MWVLKDSISRKRSETWYRPLIPSYLRHKGGTPARMGYYDNYLIDNPSCVIVGVQATAARMSQDGHLREEKASMSSAKGNCSALSPSRMRSDPNPMRLLRNFIDLVSASQ